MEYVERNLLPGEEVVYHTKLHTIIFLRPVIYAMLCFLFAQLSSPAQDSETTGVIGGLLVIVVIVSSISRFLNFTSSEFAVTNKRVLLKIGVFRRHTLELLLTKVEWIGVDQSILGRMLNYGTIFVSGTGGTRESFKTIHDPLEFRKYVHTCAEKLQK